MSATDLVAVADTAADLYFRLFHRRGSATYLFVGERGALRIGARPGPHDVLYAELTADNTASLGALRDALLRSRGIGEECGSVDPTDRCCCCTKPPHRGTQHRDDLAKCEWDAPYHHSTLTRALNRVVVLGYPALVVLPRPHRSTEGESARARKAGRGPGLLGPPNR